MEDPRYLVLVVGDDDFVPMMMMRTHHRNHRDSTVDQQRFDVDIDFD